MSQVSKIQFTSQLECHSTSCCQLLVAQPILLHINKDKLGILTYPELVNLISGNQTTSNNPASKLTLPYPTWCVSFPLIGVPETWGLGKRARELRGREREGEQADLQWRGKVMNRLENQKCNCPFKFSELFKHSRVLFLKNFEILFNLSHYSTGTKIFFFLSCHHTLLPHLLLPKSHFLSVFGGAIGQ